MKRPSYNGEGLFFRKFQLCDLFHSAYIYVAHCKVFFILFYLFGMLFLLLLISACVGKFDIRLPYRGEI